MRFEHIYSIYLELENHMWFNNGKGINIATMMSDIIYHIMVTGHHVMEFSGTFNTWYMYNNDCFNMTAVNVLFALNNTIGFKSRFAYYLKKIASADLYDCCFH